jgi:hypothetical protein
LEETLHQEHPRKYATIMQALDPLFLRIRSEYREMPGLRLTLSQAAHMWQLDVRACEAVLLALVEEGFLVRTDDGAFSSTTGKESRTSRLAASRHRR